MPQLTKSEPLCESFQVAQPVRHLPEVGAVSGLGTNGDTAVGSAAIVEVYKRSNLTRNQLQVWVAQALVPEVPLYNQATVLTLWGEVDPPHFRKAFQTLINSCDALRTVLEEVDGVPMQKVVQYLPYSMEYMDFSSLPDPRTAVKNWVSERCQAPFDLRQRLFNSVLIKIATKEFAWYLNVHHFICDGWSFELIYRFMAGLYQRSLQGRLTETIQLFQFQDYLAYEREYRDSPHHRKTEAYWKQKLAEDDEPISFHGKATTKQTTKIRRISRSLGAERTKRLKDLAVRAGPSGNTEEASLFNVFCALLVTYLHRISGNQSYSIGIPFHNRRSKAFKETIGFFSEVLPLRITIAKNETFSSLVSKIKAQTFETIRHGQYALANPHHKKAYEVVLNYHTRSFTDFNGMPARAEWVDTGHGGDSLALQIHDFELSGSLMLDFDFHCDVFTHEQSEQAVQHFFHVVDAFLADCAQPIHQLSLLSPDEKQRILIEWNNTATDYPKDRCIHQLFYEQVERTPNAPAVVLEDKALSYHELNGRANQLAHYLQSLGVGPETLVGIYMERSLEMLVGLLGILKAGGAYVPLDPNYPKDWLAFVLEDTGAPVLLTQQRMVEKLPNHGAKVICLDSEWEVISSENQENPVTGATGENLAYVIYTSGSTGRPKGVEITHRALVNFTTSAATTFALGPSDRVLQFASISFDTSVEEIFPCLVRGGTLVLRTDSMLDSVSLFLQRCRDWKVTVLDLPTVYWHELTEKLSSENLVIPEQLRLVIIGGERVLPERLMQWRKHMANHIRLLNTYGPTEATVVTTMCELTESAEVSASLREVPIGRPIPNIQTYVLDSHLNPVPVGVPGELHIGGIGLARGYLNRPELTAEKFIPNPFTGARLYKTGDLARYLPDGNLEFLGRTDHQVKIRGFRVELGEIEAVLMKHPAVRESVVLARDDKSGGKRLAAYVVPEKGAKPEPSDLRNFLKRRLPDYMVPVDFVLLASLPITPNGKVDRRALPAPDSVRQETEDSFEPPRTLTEKILAEIWCDLLGFKQVGIHHNFFELGGHSLLATQVISRLRESLKVDLALRVLFEAPTIAELAGRVDEEFRNDQRAVEIPPIVSISGDGELPLSSSQERMWFLYQLAPKSGAYNVAAPLRFTGALNRAALERSVNEMIRRHDSLRTTFRNVDGRPVQIIASASTVKLQELDLRGVPEEQGLETARHLMSVEASRPFDLERGPLLRLLLVQLGEEDQVLLLTMHHIISDQWSLGVIGREMALLYNAFCGELPPPADPLPVQYADFAAWQRQWLQGEVLETQLSYWKKQLAGLQVLELPTDHARPSVQTFRGAHLSLDFPKSLLEGLRKLSVKEGVTLYMTLLAAFETLLYRYSGQQDIVIGSPIANRNRLATEKVIGTFVNILVLRTDLSGNPTFRELLARVREVALGAFAHQEMPFDKLVEELQPERDLSRSPLVQVLFNLQNAPVREVNLQGLSWTPFEIGAWASQFDIGLSIDTEITQKIVLVYSTDLYDAATMKRMLGHYLRLLEAIVAGPEVRISQLRLLPEAEQQRSLVEWNNTKRDYPKDKCIHQFFEAQAERAPNAVAVAFEDQQLTYRELNSRANQIAHHLRALGVGPEVVVGICMERSLDMVVGLLAILKAGGAYVPIDPDYPSQRIAFMLEDSKAVVLLTQERLVKRMPEHGAWVVCVDQKGKAIARQSRKNPFSLTEPNNLAYVIYTSGSTGEPKGVQIPHRALVNFLESMRREPGLTDRDTMLSVTTISFDIAGLELYLPLMVGGRVVLVSREVASDGAQLIEKLAKSGATVLQATPATWRLLLEAGWQGSDQLKMLCGGEALCREMANQLLLRGASLWNLYGPTETTIWSALSKVESGEGAVCIGRPIANTQIYLLDSNLQSVPIGVPGELHIGGAGLARGYLNRPEVTAKRFISNPFSEEPGTRLFKTGDLARYLPDGSIEFLGRLDHQVKIHGFRIELGEIEAVLRQHPGVRETVALAREDMPGDKRLVAYIVPNQEPPPTASELRSFLKAKLPDYMVPLAFLFLEAFPLTPNGKVDRQALPAPGQAHSEPEGSFVAPRDTLECELAKIWEKILGIQPIGVEDNFFELGGHSLLAARLFAQIEKAFGKHLPLATLFQAPTVEQLASIIRQDGWLLPWSSLVPVQPSGSKAPFFWVHGDSSDVLLPRYLGLDQPLYGLQHQSQDGKRALYTRVEGIAEHYLKEICTVQPEGPYFLGGYSFGGMVAFEIAQQLQKQGQEVALLALLDPPSPGNGKFSPPINPGSINLLSNITSLRDEVYRHLHNLALLRLQEKLTYVLERVNGKIVSTQPVAKKVACKVYLGMGCLLPVCLRSFYILEVYHQATRAYVPQSYPGRVILFKGEERPNDYRLNWERLVAGGLEIHEVTGNHVDMLREPHIQVWAEQLRDHLHKGQAGTSDNHAGACSTSSDFHISDFGVQQDRG
jgi:amino acid adenylation domain-containing protein